MGAALGREAAEHILGLYWNPRNFPVDVEGIARALQVELRAFADPGAMYSGAYYPAFAETAGRPAILVNARDVPTRQRFTIAHELGHHVLHGREAFRDPLHQFPGADPREIEANAFAANLLMPEREFRLLVESGKYTGGQLCQVFDVSAPALRARMENLGYL